jgi:lipopolysaccharide export system protein LptC
VRRTGGIIALLAVLAGASWWLGGDSPPVPEPASPLAGETRSIDYRVSGLDIIRMTPSGEPAHRLLATELRHFTDDLTTELSAPTLIVFQSDEPPWEIDAERAWMSADGSLLLLSGAVEINREGGDRTRPMHLVTRELRIQPREDYAETDEAVRVESERDWIDAVGMQAWLRPPSRIKFLSEARGYHEPN